MKENKLAQAQGYGGIVSLAASEENQQLLKKRSFRDLGSFSYHEFFRKQDGTELPLQEPDASKRIVILFKPF